MPNWCECDLEVTSKNVRELKKFKAFAKTGRKALDENKFIPYPLTFEVMDLAHKKNPLYPGGFNSGGYDWRCNNWGTKWGICNSETTGEEYDGKKGGTLSYTFECAWSPCTPVIQKMSEMFPELTFKLDYFECSMGFKGQCVFRDGKVVKDRFSDNYRGGRGG